MAKLEKKRDADEEQNFPGQFKIPKRKKQTTPKKISNPKDETIPEFTLPSNCPVELSELIIYFASLNTLYTFFTVQRQIVCTYESLKASIEKSCGKEFNLDILSRICVIYPYINLYWVDKSTLVEGSIRQLQFGKEEIDEIDVVYVLVIEFNDVRKVRVATGRLQTSLINEIGISRKENHQNKIHNRNLEFKERLYKFYTEAIQTDQDPVMLLLELSSSIIPQSPVLSGSTTFQILETSNIEKSRPESLFDLLSDLKSQPWYVDQIVPNGIKSDESQTSKFGELDVPVSEEIQRALETTKNISRFYTHQAMALNEINKGNNVIISTATSSGKSLIYQVPVLSALECDRDARAFYIFPTKALAQDQKRSLEELIGNCPNLREFVNVDTFDGDTPSIGTTRSTIRDTANVIFTNPDMLHVTILPQHKLWSNFLKNLKFVVVDELHYYTNSFGSHCVQIMRRLQRICFMYGNTNVKFISCSATITNPIESMKSFFNISSTSLISCDGAPKGAKHFVIYNPSYKSISNPSEGRKSALEECISLFLYLLCRGVRTICFAKCRRVCELIYKGVMKHVVGTELEEKVKSYRGGYMVSDRRAIEKNLFVGDLMGVIATNALELGVDIGSLDAVIHLGFPHHISSYRQQHGRAGRREKDSLSILITEGDSPLDQFYAANPNELFTAPLENLKLDILNEAILESHLQCAAAEFPINAETDYVFFGNSYDDDVGDSKTLVQDLLEKKLRRDGKSGLYYPLLKYENHPAKYVNIRCIDESVFRVIDTATNQDLEDVEAARVPFTLYEGAIFLNQGQSYLVMEVNAEKQYAKVRRTNAEYITSHRQTKTIYPKEVIDKIEIWPLIDDKRIESCAFYGSIQIETKVYGFHKINPMTKQIVSSVSDIESPMIVKSSFGCWIDLSNSVVNRFKSLNLSLNPSIHGAVHMLRNILPIYLQVEGSEELNDIACYCKSGNGQKSLNR